MRYTQLAEPSCWQGAHCSICARTSLARAGRARTPRSSEKCSMAMARMLWATALVVGQALVLTLGRVERLLGVLNAHGPL